MYKLKCLLNICSYLSCVIIIEKPNAFNKNTITLCRHGICLKSEFIIQMWLYNMLYQQQS